MVTKTHEKSTFRDFYKKFHVYHVYQMQFLTIYSHKHGIHVFFHSCIPQLFHFFVQFDDSPLSCELFSAA